MIENQLEKMIFLEMGRKEIRSAIKRVTEITSRHMTPELKGIGREFFY